MKDFFIPLLMQINMWTVGYVSSPMVYRKYIRTFSS